VGSYTNTKTERRGENVKIIKYLEFDLEDQDEMFEKWAKYLEKSAKNPEKYPKYISGPDQNILKKVRRILRNIQSTFLDQTGTHDLKILLTASL